MKRCTRTWPFVILGAALTALAVYPSLACPRRHGFAVQPISATQPASQAKKGPDADDRNTIVANARAYMEAFNRRDVKMLLTLFTDDCDILEVDGSHVRGLKELEAELKDTFESDPKAQISVAVESVTLLNRDAAIETGTMTYFPDGKTLTAEVDYQVTHVKTDKGWFMRQVRGISRTVLSPYDRLRDLEWLVGDWVEESNDSLLETHYRWDANKTFLLQEFTIRIKGQKALTGSQRIGWDPLTKQIKGWVFDSEGGYGENLWSAIDDGWVMQFRGVRADGKVVMATNEIVQLAAERFRWESADRIVGEERAPNYTAIAVRRPPSPQR